MIDWLAFESPTLPPAQHTNCVRVFLRHGGVMLVEPSPHTEAERQRLREWIASEQIDAIFLTHQHPDHHAFVETLCVERNVPIFADSETINRLPTALTSRVTCKSVTTSDIWSLADGSSLRVMATPGHAPGHLILFNETHVIAGDMIAGDGTILIDPDDDGVMRDYLDSLTRMRDLGERMLIPAHGNSFASTNAICCEYLAHRQKRHAQVSAEYDAILKDGEMPTSMSVAKRVYPHLPSAYMFLAEKSVRAIFEYLGLKTN